MTTRQYLLQHILHLSAEWHKVTDAAQKKNIQEALMFYATELQKHDKTNPPYTQ